jgi:hypothetical protein
MVDAPVGTGIRSNSSRPSARSRFRWVGVWVGRGSGSAGRYRPVSGDGPASTPVPWSPPAGRSTLSGSIGGFSCSARSASPRFRRRIRLSRRSCWPLARFHGIRSPIEDGDWLCSAGSHRGSHSGSRGVRECQIRPVCTPAHAPGRTSPFFASRGSWVRVPSSPPF